MSRVRALIVLLCAGLGIALPAIAMVVLTEEEGRSASAGRSSVGVAGQVELSPVLSGRGAGRGTAFIVERPQGQPQLVLQARLPPVPKGELYEIWLYNSVGDSISLGEAARAHGGLVQGGGRLPRGYAERWRYVDVSRERARSGRGAPSGRSVLRGGLRRNEARLE